MNALSPEERLTELEMKVTYQDDVIEALNQVVIELRDAVGGLKERLETMDLEATDTSSSSIPHERPPHY